MRLSSRHTVLITGLLIVAPFAAPAQQACNPPAQPKLDWMGTQTGCRPTGPPCAVGEVINFKALPVAGSFQSCDGFAWSFGDPANGFASVQNPPYAFSSPGEFNVSLGVFNTAGNTSASHLITLTVQPLTDEFKATPPKAILGQPVVLSWITRFTTRVHIDPLNMDFGPSGSVTVTPVKTTLYALVPFGAAGQGALQMVTVEVTPTRRRAARH